jgi:hypothetical protein
VSKDRQITVRVDATFEGRVEALRIRLLATELHEWELSRTALLRRLMVEGLAVFEGRFCP